MNDAPKLPDDEVYPGTGPTRPGDVIRVPAGTVPAQLEMRPGAVLEADRPPTFTDAEIDAIEHLHPDPRETIESAEEMHELRDSVLEKMRALRAEEAP